MDSAWKMEKQKVRTRISSSLLVYVILIDNFKVIFLNFVFLNHVNGSVTRSSTSTKHQDRFLNLV